MTEPAVKRWTSVPGFAPATAKLIEKLSAGTVGDVLTDEELTEVCGKDCAVEGDGRRYVLSAVKHVERVKGIVWRRMRGVGTVKCLEMNERIEVALCYRRHISKSSKRAARVISTISIDSIEDGKRPGLLALMAQLGALAMFSSPDTQKKMEARGIVSPPDSKRLLEPFEKRA
jgi:hypothetical protein